MPNPSQVLSEVVGKKKGGAAIQQLVSRAFTTRNLLHFSHWLTGSYAGHMALGDLYDQIVEDIDEIVETYQGRFGLLPSFGCESATVTCDVSDMVERVKCEAAWVEKNRDFISGGDSSIGNLVDTLIGHYHKTAYKLENLK